eukprot:18618-Heterococcus_DN1.PRE.2
MPDLQLTTTMTHAVEARAFCSARESVHCIAACLSVDFVSGVMLEQQLPLRRALAKSTCTAHQSTQQLPLQ